MKNLFIIALLAGSFAFVAPAAVQAEDAAAPATSPPVVSEAAPAAADADMMAKVMERTQAGEMHKLLETLAGSWTYTSTMQGAEPTTGTAENTVAYNGRFLVSKVKGTMDMNGQKTPFEGESVIGYDTIAQQFQGVWFDSFATGMMTSTGTYDAATKMITEKAQGSCPMTGATRHFRNELKFIDADHYSYTMYSTDPAGGEFKMLEIQYAKVK